MKKIMNHLFEVNNTIYILQKMGFYTLPYGFEINFKYYGAYSMKLESILNKLDKKEKLIQDFYNNYEELYLKVLTYYFDEEHIKILDILKDNLSIFQDFINMERGLELLVTIIELKKYYLQNSSFDKINEELKRKNPLFINDELNRQAYDILIKLKIINRDNNLVLKLEKIV